MPGHGWSGILESLKLMSSATTSVARRRYLVILDLNGTLLHRLTRTPERQLLAANSFASALKSDCNVNGNPIYFRPGLSSFAKGLLERFEVAVWTSAMDRNAVPMVQHVFGKLLPREALCKILSPHSHTYLRHLESHGRVEVAEKESQYALKFLWSQEHCTILSRSAAGKPSFEKDLSQVWKQYSECSPAHTILIDDNPAKFKNYSLNAIAIPEYLVTDHSVDPRKDKILAELLEYLNILEASQPEDVREYMRGKPFLSPVSPAQDTSSTDSRSLTKALDKLNLD